MSDLGLGQLRIPRLMQSTAAKKPILAFTLCSFHFAPLFFVIDGLPFYPADGPGCYGDQVSVPQNYGRAKTVKPNRILRCQV